MIRRQPAVQVGTMDVRDGNGRHVCFLVSRLLVSIVVFSALGR